MAALIVVDDKIVVVRQRKGADAYYLLPGGGVQLFETIADALRREVAEETGLLVEPDRPLFINDTIDPGGSRHVINLTFLCSVLGGELLAEPGDATIDAVELVDPQSLVTLDFRPPIAHQILQACRERFRSPARYLGPVWIPESHA